jgi:uncharacterized protein (TIGR02285 family)
MKIVTFALLLIPVLPMQTVAAQPITVAWRDNPPYNFVDQGKEKGFLLARGKRIFEQAQVPAQFVLEPTKRIWAKFRVGTPMYCSLGRYRIAEREPIMQYSLPIHIDPPRIVLASPAAAQQVRQHATLASLLADPALAMGMSDGASFGTEIDAMLANARSKVERRTVESPLMMKLLAANRVSFVIVDRIAWQYWRMHDPAALGVVPHDLPDMPAGQKRYLVCSKDVPADVMHRLNASIKAMKIGTQLPNEAELNQ